MGNYTVRLRKELVSNRQLATEISRVLAKYELKAPEGFTVVWGPTVIEEAKTAFDIPRIWEIGIPPPEILAAAFRLEEKFRF